MPKMLARDNGKEWMPEVLKEGLTNKDRDLRERKGGGWEWEREWDGEEGDLHGGS